MAMMRVGFECPDRVITDVRDIARRMEETLELAQNAFRPGWDA
jgi:hypothetical protein